MDVTIKYKKRPSNPIQLAKLIGDIAIGEIEDLVSENKEEPSITWAGRWIKWWHGTSKEANCCPAVCYCPIGCQGYVEEEIGVTSFLSYL